MSKVEDYIYQFEGEQHKILLYFHEMFVTEFHLTSKLSFKVPFYYGKSWICSLSCKQDAPVELGFLRGNELSNSQGLLQSKGRKQLYSIEFEKLSDVPESLIREILTEAIILDETIPYQLKRKRK